MANLTSDELLSLVSQMEVEAVNQQETRNADNEELQRRYDGELYGNEVEGRSSVVSQDVKDTVESDMPGLVRTILGSGPIMSFKANNPNNEKEVAEAAEKTAYVDWLVRGQSKSFRVNYGFLKDTDMLKIGVLKYFFEETEKTEEVSFKNVAVIELDEIINDLATKPFYDDFEVISEEENEDGTFNLKFKVKTKRQEIKVVGVPVDTFLISPGATDEDDAKLVGDQSTKTRGQLLSEGFKRKVISSLPIMNVSGSSSRYIESDKDGQVDPSDFGEWASQFVEISDLYVMIDYDQDGIAERRHIIKSGNVILENEAFDHVPYAIASAILTPHKAIGEGRAEQVVKVAEVKTALTRQMLDNGYMANNPKLSINDNVNIDDALSDAIGGVVRFSGEGSPMNNIGVIAVPFIGDKSLLLIQHMDQIKASLVGTQMASQGLNADQLTKETATRFEGVRDAAAAKLELVTRIIAEVGFRKLYTGIAWIASQYQDTEREFTVLGKAMTANPTNWRYEHQVDSEIGLGAGDNDEAITNLTGIWQIQSQLKMAQSPLVDDSKMFNTMNKMVRALEFKDTAQFFNDPSEPAQLLKTENEQLNGLVLQLQEQQELMIQQLQQSNQLADAAKVEQQTALLKERNSNALNVAKLQSSSEQFQIKTASDSKKSEQDLALKLTDLELKYGKDLNSEMQDNMLVFDPASGDFTNA
jgi:hypothetical protein